MVPQVPNFFRLLMVEIRTMPLRILYKFKIHYLTIIYLSALTASILHLTYYNNEGSKNFETFPILGHNVGCHTSWGIMSGGKMSGDSTLGHKMSGDSIFGHKMSGASIFGHKMSGDSIFGHTMSGDSIFGHTVFSN